MQTLNIAHNESFKWLTLIKQRELFYYLYNYESLSNISLTSSTGTSLDFNEQTHHGSIRPHICDLFPNSINIWTGMQKAVEFQIYNAASLQSHIVGFVS